jgi:hypothetical protein
MELLTQTIQRFAVACNPGSGGLFLPTWYKYLEGAQDETGRCEILLNFPNDIGRILLAVIEIMLRVGGLVAVAFVIYGGFRYITSQGEPDNTKSARQTITNAIIGLVITLVATATVAFFARTLTAPEPVDDGAYIQHIQEVKA